MEWSKLKNIILLILLLVNLFFFALVLYQEQKSAQYEKEVQESVLLVLQQNEISVSKACVPWDDSLYPKKLERNRKTEETLAGEMLGAIRQTEVGAVAEYQGDKGSVQFYQTGELSVRFDAGAEPGLPSHCLEYLKNLGLEATVLQETESGGGTRVSVQQEFAGVPIFNCLGKAEYKDGTLRWLTLWQLHATATEQTQESPLSPATLLIRFLNTVQDDACTEIQEITVGYRYHSGLSRVATLIPTWKVKTDVGDYLVDCMTGETEKVGVIP